MSMVVSAQEKVKEVVSDSYNRNSLSVVIVDRGQFGSAINEIIANLEISSKFDHNNIVTKRIRIDSETPLVTQEHFDALAQNSDIGKEILSFIYDRQSDGLFTTRLIEERGLYNAKDQDIADSASAKVDDMSFEWGMGLVNSAYVVFIDFSECEVSYSDKGIPSYICTSNVAAYKLNCDEAVLDDFYTNGYADVSYTPEQQAKAREAFDKMKFDLVFQTTTSAVGSSTGENASYAKAGQSVLDNAIYEFEKDIKTWKTTTSIISRHPLAAKIGTKENLKNGDRYQAYTYKENADGELISVKRGMVRATVVADNAKVADGETEPSFFYQISGAVNIKEGYTLQQKNDLKLGAMLAVGMNGTGLRVGLDLDYIANIGKRGCIVYPMINLGYTMSNVADRGFVDYHIGIGYGVPCSRFFEITPYATIGGFGAKKEAYGKSHLATAVEPGIRLAVTFQPFAIFLTGGYQAVIATDVPDVFNSGLVIKGGIKWTF